MTFPELLPIVHVYVQSIEGILKVGALQHQISMRKPEQIQGEEMSSPLSPLLPPLQSPARTENSKLPLEAKDSSSDSEEELPRVLDLPARKPEPPAYNKWWLGNLLSQAKRGAGPGEAPRGIACGNGREQGISSSSCQQLSKARKPPHKSWGQVAKKSQKTCHQVAKGSQKSTGKPAKMSQKSSGQRLKDLHKSSGQRLKDFHKSSGQVTKDFHKSSGLVKKDLHKSSGQVTKDFHKSSGQAMKDSQKSWSQVAECFPKSSGNVTKEFHTSSVQGAKVSEKSFGQEKKTSHKSCGQVAKDCHKSSAPLAKHSQKSSGQVDQAPQQTPQTKQSCLEPPGLTKGAVPKEPVATKRPGEPLEHDKSKRVRKGKS
ncbi:PREDICTED: muscle M-line assembly protein unc-89-like [Ficedula albicollis]|uniref:muscle M-line assembly protein unc-89-like n=1 Tax=Ficedula albicollis TaxID=59894 RepID=UPI0007AD8A76|nr:PREDICTED: muscle M-line assembly protein unc-89-like [Ficedula albicollis]